MPNRSGSDMHPKIMRVKRDYVLFPDQVGDEEP
jgi:hypothetical protein